MAGIACTHVAMAGLVEYCILGWRGPVLVLEDPRVGWYMEVRDLHMSCGLEFPAGFLIDSNRRCSSVMETQLTVHHRSTNNWNSNKACECVGYEVS